MLPIVRDALRALRRGRWVVAGAIAVLAIGLACTIAEIEIVNATLFDLLPFARPDELVTLGLYRDGAARHYEQPDFGGSMRLGDFLDFARAQTSFAEVAGCIPYTSNVRAGTLEARFDGCAVSPSFFPLLGVEPTLGRAFVSEDDRPDAAPTMIISYGFWRDAFGFDPHVLGRVVEQDGFPFRVVGVMPAGFAFPRDESFWVPLQRLPYSIQPDFSRRILFRMVGVVGRLKPGVVRVQARTELEGIARRLAIAYPATNRDMTAADVHPLHRAFVSGMYARLLYAMLGGAAVVLLIAGFNAASLLLARGIRRLPVVALQSALGATRRRLLAQNLVEVMLVGTAAALLALPLAQVIVGLLRPVVVSPGRTSGAAPPWVNLHLGGAVLGLAVAALVVATALTGLLPGWLVARIDPVRILRIGSDRLAGAGFGRALSALVVLQLAITVPVVVCGGLLSRSLARQEQFRWGFAVDHLFTNRLGIRGPGYPNDAARTRFMQGLSATLAADPAVEAFAFTDRGPELYTARFDNAVTYETDAGVGSAAAATGEDSAAVRRAVLEHVSWNYLSTLSVPLVQGRAFVDTDPDQAPRSAIVDETFARANFPHASAVGRRFRLRYGNGHTSDWYDIVGVVADTASAGPVGVTAGRPACAFMLLGTYLPADLTVVLRGRGTSRAMGQRLNADIARVDPTLTLFRPTLTPRERLFGALRLRRQLTVVLIAFGVLALVLGAAGIYGVTSYGVSTRTREFGLRTALGATPGVIARLVLRRGVRLAAAGLLAGGLLTVALTRLLSAFLAGLLYQVGRYDVLVYAATVLTVTTVVLLASLLPARRAATVQPTEALRNE